MQSRVLKFASSAPSWKAGRNLASAYASVETTSVVSTADVAVC